MFISTNEHSLRVSFLYTTCGYEKKLRTQPLHRAWLPYTETETYICAIFVPLWMYTITLKSTIPEYQDSIASTLPSADLDQTYSKQYVEWSKFYVAQKDISHCSFHFATNNLLYPNPMLGFYSFRYYCWVLRVHLLIHHYVHVAIENCEIEWYVLRSLRSIKKVLVIFFLWCY